MSKVHKKPSARHEEETTPICEVPGSGSCADGIRIGRGVGLQARQSNVYSINGYSGSISIRPGQYIHIPTYTVEREWGIGRWTNWMGLRQFGLRQWGGGEEYGTNGVIISGRKVYTEVAFASHSFNIKLPLVYAAILLGVALFLMVWAFVASTTWLINRRGRSEIQAAPTTNRPP